MAGSRFVAEGGILVPNNASNSTINNTTVDGVLIASANVSVLGTANLAGNVVVSGATLNVSSNTTITGTLIASSLVLGGGTANLSGNVVVGGSTLNIASNTTIDGTLAASGLTVTGAANLAGNVAVGGAMLNVSSNMTFTGIGTFTSNVTFNGNVTFTAGPPTFIGDQIAVGDLVPNDNTYSIGNTTSIWNTLHANNVLVYRGNVNIGNTTVNTFANSTILRISNSSSNVIISASNLTIGSAVVNSTSFSGTANNALRLGGTLAADYATTSSITSALNAYTGTSSVVTVGTLTSGSLGSGFTTVEVARGGTGTTSITGIVRGNGTGAFTAATGAQIVSAIGATYVDNATFASTAGALTTTNNYRVNSLGVATDASGTSGEIRATGNITAYYSDMRLKKFVGPIVDPLAKLKQLSGFYYTGNETAGKLGYNTTKTEVGVSAQDVENVLPEIVQPAPIDPQYMTLDYGRLVPLLIEAIKELSDKVETLERKLEK